MSLIVFSKSRPSSIAPSTSSLAPNTLENSWNLFVSSSRMRCSAMLPLFEKFTTTTLCFWPKRCTRPMRCSTRCGFQGRS
jgi:hypothetical protein